MDRGGGGQPREEVHQRGLGGLGERGAYLEAKGFQASKVPGTLLLATTGGKRPGKKLMPLSTSTAFAPTKELLVRAWKDGCWVTIPIWMRCVVGLAGDVLRGRAGPVLRRTFDPYAIMFFMIQTV